MNRNKFNLMTHLLQGGSTLCSRRTDITKDYCTGRERLLQVSSIRGAWLFLMDNELTSMPSPLNFEPLQFQISCGEIGISERTEVSTKSALQGCFGVTQQTQRLKNINMELFAQ